MAAVIPEEGPPQVVATAAINLPIGATVVQGEAFALGLAAKLSAGQVDDLTADCQPAIRQAEQGAPTRSKLGTLHDAPPELRTASITWVSSHLSPEDFKARRPELHWWRRSINQLADLLVERHNSGWYPADQAREIKDLRHCLREVNQFLGRRVSTLLSWKGETPPWSEPLQSAKERASQKAQGLTPAQAYRKGSDGGTNKKDLLRQLVDGQLNAQQGHCWQGSLNKLNATASCRTCGLYLEQTYSLDKFKMLMGLPCKHRPAVIPPQLDGVSRTHRWYCLGSELACFDCRCVLKVGKRVPTQVALQVCKGRPKQAPNKRVVNQLPKSWPFPPSNPFPACNSTNCGPGANAGAPNQQLSSHQVGSSLRDSTKKGRLGGSQRRGSPPTTVGASEPQGKRTKLDPATAGATTLAQVLRFGAKPQQQTRPGASAVDSHDVDPGQDQPGDPRGPLRQTGITQWLSQRRPQVRVPPWPEPQSRKQQQGPLKEAVLPPGQAPRGGGGLPALTARSPANLRSEAVCRAGSTSFLTAAWFKPTTSSSAQPRCNRQYVRSFH